MSSNPYSGTLPQQSISQADVSLPPLAAVAAMERASISATAAICPLPGLEPSRLGKFLVVWRTLSPLLQGVSPAPKHGPQNAVRMMAPASIRSDTAPFFTRSANTGWKDRLPVKIHRIRSSYPSVHGLLPSHCCRSRLHSLQSLPAVPSDRRPSLCQEG